MLCIVLGVTQGNILEIVVDSSLEIQSAFFCLKRRIQPAVGKWTIKNPSRPEKRERYGQRPEMQNIPRKK